MSAPLIIIVDDDPGMLRAMEALIRSLGYRTAAFSSAEEFLSSGTAQNCTCIVSDLHMPGMTGIELVERLRGPPCISCAPVFLVSARMTAAASSSNAAALLQKPFDPNALVKLIEEAIETARLPPL